MLVLSDAELPVEAGADALSEAIAPAGGFIPPITGQDVYLPVVRVASRYRRLGPVVGPAVLLDRLVGEG